MMVQNALFGATTVLLGALGGCAKILAIGGKE